MSHGGPWRGPCLLDSTLVSAPSSCSILLLAWGCAQEATEPGEAGTLSFLVVSGDGQSGAVGTELPQPFDQRNTLRRRRLQQCQRPPGDGRSIRSRHRHVDAEGVDFHQSILYGHHRDQWSPLRRRRPRRQYQRSDGRSVRPSHRHVDDEGVDAHASVSPRSPESSTQWVGTPILCCT